MILCSDRTIQKKDKQKRYRTNVRCICGDNYIACILVCIVQSFGK